jgi:hypothetical protein
MITFTETVQSLRLQIEGPGISLSFATKTAVCVLGGRFPRSSPSSRLAGLLPAISRSLGLIAQCRMYRLLSRSLRLLCVQSTLKSQPRLRKSEVGDCPSAIGRPSSASACQVSNPRPKSASARGDPDATARSQPDGAFPAWREELARETPTLSGSSGRSGTATVTTP